jgi:hypothetical protein
MGAGRAGAVIEVAADGVFVVVMRMIVAVFLTMLVVMRMAVRAAVGMLVAVYMLVLALVHMLMDMRRTIGMRMRVGMGAIQHRSIMTMHVVVLMAMAVRMHRAVFMHVRMLVCPTLDLHFTCPAAANRTHPLVSFIRFRFP